MITLKTMPTKKATVAKSTAGGCFSHMAACNYRRLLWTELYKVVRVNYHRVVEFEITGDVTMQPAGNITIKLPEFVSVVSQAEANAIMKFFREDPRPAVIAAGTDIEKGELLVLTASGKLLVLDLKANNIPIYPSRPGGIGRSVVMDDTPWQGVVIIYSDWIVANARETNVSVEL